MTQLGFGGVGVDILATVAAFPNPDDKIRTTSLKVLFYKESIRSEFKIMCIGLLYMNNTKN